MKPKKDEPMTFWRWIHKYRAKIGLLAFIITIPLTLVLIAYLGPYYSNKSVHFDSEYTDVQRKFVSVDDIDALKLNIEWDTLIYTVYSDTEPSVITTHGSYKFNMSYEEKGNYDVTSVAVTPVLHTDWFAYYSIGSKVSLLTTSKLISLVWDEAFPMRKLLFIEVNEPNLYLKVEYTYTIASEPVTKTAYVKYSLKGINPLDVEN